MCFCTIKGKIQIGTENKKQYNDDTVEVEFLAFYVWEDEKDTNTVVKYLSQVYVYIIKKQRKLNKVTK